MLGSWPICCRSRMRSRSRSSCRRTVGSVETIRQTRLGITLPVAVSFLQTFFMVGSASPFTTILVPAAGAESVGSPAKAGAAKLARARQRGRATRIAFLDLVKDETIALWPSCRNLNESIVATFLKRRENTAHGPHFEVVPARLGQHRAQGAARG